MAERKIRHLNMLQPTDEVGVLLERAKQQSGRGRSGLLVKESGDTRFRVKYDKKGNVILTVT